jgi:hypothetical protein
LFAVNYAIDKALDAMVAGLEQELEQKLGAELQSLQHEVTNPTVGSELIKDSVVPSTSNNRADNSGTKSDNSGDMSNNSGPVNAMADTASNTPNSVGIKNEGPIEYSAEISLEKAALVKEKITVNEKATVLKILASKLGASELRQLQDMASGGLTIEEKRQIRKLLLDKLTPAEYDQLISIAKKYGLSQGRTYSEVVSNRD